MSTISEEIDVRISERISDNCSERISVDFNKQISVEFSEQIGGSSTEIIRVEIRGAKVRPLPFPSLLFERRMPAFCGYIFQLVDSKVLTRTRGGCKDPALHANKTC